VINAIAESTFFDIPHRIDELDREIAGLARQGAHRLFIYRRVEISGEYHRNRFHLALRHMTGHQFHTGYPVRQIGKEGGEVARLSRTEPQQAPPNDKALLAWTRSKKTTPEPQWASGSLEKLVVRLRRDGLATDLGSATKHDPSQAEHPRKQCEGGRLGNGYETQAEVRFGVRGSTT